MPQDNHTSPRPDSDLRPSRPLADLAQEWRTRASRLLGRDATEWAREAVAVEPAKLLRAEDVPLERAALADGARKRTEVLWINPRATEALAGGSGAQMPLPMVGGAA